MKIKFILLISILLLNTKIVFANEITITDIENHWAKEGIVRMITNNKLSGYPDNTFRPNENVTVLEFIKMMVDSFNIKLEENGISKWPDYYIATAQKYELIYDYNKNLTRYEAIEILSKFLNLNSVSSTNNKIKDIDKKYKTIISKLIKLKIINGYEDNTFRGENNLTRAEAVTIVIRAMEANNEMIENKKYKIEERFTNYGKKEVANQIRYEIIKNKVHFYDTGRFSSIEDYTINEKYVTNNKIIDIIEGLVSENSYTALYYVPSKYIINQIIIKYGENEEKINQNLEYFSATYYEDKLYDLNRITLKENFSHECYLKITIKKMWKEMYEHQKGNYIDEHIKSKFLNVLKKEFKNDSEKIIEYMLSVYEKTINNSEEIAEQIQIGKVLINTYKTDATSLEFYFEKLSS